jgi:hypothetical protein
MANRIQEYNVPATTFVNSTSRYANSRVYLYGDQKRITFEIYKRIPIVENPNDKVTTIPPGAEYRPDIVSKQVYGVVDFWWTILEANQMNDVFDFKAGTSIRLPVNVF